MNVDAFDNLTYKPDKRVAPCPRQLPCLLLLLLPPPPPPPDSKPGSMRTSTRRSGLLPRFFMAPHQATAWSPPAGPAPPRALGRAGPARPGRWPTRSEGWRMAQKGYAPQAVFIQITVPACRSRLPSLSSPCPPPY